MNDLIFEGTVSDVHESEFESRNHEMLKRVDFVVTEDEGLHPIRQAYPFQVFGERYERFADRIKDGARVSVKFYLGGVKTSQSGIRYGIINVWNIEEV